MKNLIFRYGLYAGCILVILALFNWWLIAPYLGYTASEIFGYSSMIVSLLTIPIGIKYYKNKLNNGTTTFGEAFKIGTGISLIASIVMFLYGMLFFLISYDTFMAWYEKSVGAEEWQQIETQMKAMPEYVYSPFFQGLILLITVFLIGLIITLISSLVLKSTR